MPIQYQEMFIILRMELLNNVTDARNIKCQREFGLLSQKHVLYVEI